MGSTNPAQGVSGVTRRQGATSRGVKSQRQGLSEGSSNACYGGVATVSLAILANNDTYRRLQCGDNSALTYLVC